VMQRFDATGDVATHQGQRSQLAHCHALSRHEHFMIVQMLVDSPRTRLVDHHAQFVLENGILISYGAFCRAVRQLGFTRKKVRSIAYKCDRDKANAWLAEVLTYHSVEELGVLDETSKDLDALKGDYGYSLRGTICSAQDQALELNQVRISALCLYTVEDGFLDYAFTPKTFTKEGFLHVTTEYFRDWRGVLRPPMLLQHLDARRRRCSCVLLDNASIHHCHEFVDRIAAKRCVVRYIPPYCHFLSPLDNGAFGALVRWLRSHWQYVQSVGIERSMVDGMHDLNGDGGRLARYCFRNCRYM